MSLHTPLKKRAESTNVVIMRLNTSIKLKTDISKFLLWAFKLKAFLSCFKCCIENNY